MPNLELYGTAGCLYTAEVREWLEWKGSEFREYDVETHAEAQEKLRRIARAPYTVPLLVEDGRVIQTGWQGRGCIAAGK